MKWLKIEGSLNNNDFKYGIVYLLSCYFVICVHARSGDAL
ncbi:hypothetical protein VCHA43P273_220069 [Vibrio chagasii]|nr:hypothetical protein VCHA43P273_220069 [Vibrio chagasii]